MEHAAYISKPDYKRQQKDMPDSTAPRYDIPLTRHQLSYLNGGSGSGKTTRAIELFHPETHSPSHRLTAWLKRCVHEGSRPDLPQLLPVLRRHRVDSRKDGPEVRPPRHHLGRGLHRAPAHSEDFPRLARIQRCLSHLLRRPGSETADCGQDAARLAEKDGRLLRRGRGWPPQKAYSCPTRQGPVPRGAKGAHRLPMGGGDRFVEAWKPRDLILSSRQKATEHRSFYSSITRTAFKTPLCPSWPTTKTAGSKTYKSPFQALTAEKSWCWTTPWMSA